MASSKHRGASRRGVLLLLVLAMLAMFALLGLSFVLITSSANRASETYAKVGQYTEPPESLLDQGAMQLFRGASSLNSPFYGEGLLEDLCGSDTAQGTMQNVTPLLGTTTQIQSITFNGQLYDTSGNALPASEPTRRVGCVLTVTNPASPAAMTSYRIVSYDRSIVEWWRRMEEIHGTGGDDPEHRWHVSLTELGAGRLRQLGREYAAGYLITEAAPELPLPRLYANRAYAVYRLPAGPVTPPRARP